MSITSKVNLDFVRSQGFRTAGTIAGLILVSIMIFNAGIAVGYHKARFAAEWGGNYERNFGFDRRDGRTASRDEINKRFFGLTKERRGLERLSQGILPPPPGYPGEMMNPHGVAGQILSVATSSFIIKDIDGLEKQVNFSSTTPVSQGWSAIKASLLKADDRVMVIGEANQQGQIDSKFIRLMPN